MLLPKLIGSYECELHDVIQLICQTRYGRIIDAGAAEGYYAIGLARRIPAARVVAFEMAPKSRELLALMAQVNGVAGHLTIRGACDPASLSAELDSPDDLMLLVCDVEGYERVLLDPDRVPGLRRTDVLVEFHDHEDATISSTILSRFRATHDLQVIDVARRDPSAYPILSCLRPEDRAAALEEFRPPDQQFAWMTVRRCPPTAS
jgi:hypothetical protein